MIMLNDSDFTARDLTFLVDFEMTPLLDMTLEITDIETPELTAPAVHYYAEAEDTDDLDLITWLHAFNTWSRNTETGRINGCSFRHAGRKPRSTK